MLNIILLGDLVSFDNFQCELPEEASLAIFNLEAPIIENYFNPIPKAGPNLYSLKLYSPSNNKNIKLLACLANNHMMDFGKNGMEKTIIECNKRNIETIGIGNNLFEARESKIITINNKIIGIINCCERQFGVADYTRGGVANIGPWIYKEIIRLKSITDIVIISIHGALEDSCWPSPEWQELLRSFIDVGANIVHGHHSHVPQGFEEYKNGLIYYGLGNFVVDPQKWDKNFNNLWSIVPQISIDNQNQLIYKNRVAIIESNKGFNIKLIEIEKDSYYYNYLKRSNLPLNDRNLLVSLWHEMSMITFSTHYSYYLNIKKKYKIINRQNIILFFKTIVYQILKFSQARNNSKRNSFLLLYHIFSCETHSNAIFTSLGILSGEIEDKRNKKSEILTQEFLLDHI